MNRVATTKISRMATNSAKVRRRQKSWRVQLAAIVGVALVGISIIGAAPGRSSDHGSLEQISAAYPVVVVQAGDSLWSVAQRASGGEDPRVVVDRLKALNELGSSVLQPGQVLRVE